MQLNICHHPWMVPLGRLFKTYPVLVGMIIGVIAGPLIVVGHNRLNLWWIERNAHPMAFITSPSFLSLIMVGAAVGLFVGIVGGYLYKRYIGKL